MTLLWIFAALLAFMALIWSVHAVDDYGATHYGYAPFAMPNVLFMLIPHGLLLFAIRDGGGHTQVLLALIGATTLGMLFLVRSRTNGWIACFAASLLLLFAPVLVFTVLFRRLVQAGGNAGEGD